METRFKDSKLTTEESCEVIQIVLEHFNVTEQQLFGKKPGKDRVTAARCVAMGLLYAYSRMNQSSIGRFLKRDHGTVNYNRKRIDNAMFTKQDVYDDLMILEERVKEILARKVFMDISHNPLKVAV